MLEKYCQNLRKWVLPYLAFSVHVPILNLLSFTRTLENTSTDIRHFLSWLLM